jgi:HEPN domain-containing protein
LLPRVHIINSGDSEHDLRDLIYENRHLKIGKIKEIANHKRNTDKEYVDKRYFDDSYVRKILKEEITKRGK